MRASRHAIHGSAKGRGAAAPSAMAGRTGRPSLGRRIVSAALAVVLALGMAPTLAFADAAEGDAAAGAGEGTAQSNQVPQAQLTLTANGAGQEDPSGNATVGAGTQGQAPDGIVVAIEEDIALVAEYIPDPYKENTVGCIWLVDADADADHMGAEYAVTEVHTSKAYKMVVDGEAFPSGGEEPDALAITGLAIFPNNELAAPEQFYSISFSYDAVTGTWSLDEGLYVEDNGANQGYESVSRAVPEGWYNIFARTGHAHMAYGWEKRWEAYAPIHVVSDGSFGAKGAKVFAYNARYADADYDGHVDGEGEVVGAATALTQIGQTDRIRMNVGLGTLSDIVGSHEPEDVVELEEVVLYDAGCADMAAAQAKMDNGDTSCLPSGITFADESKRAVAWSRAEGDKDIRWHLKDEPDLHKEGYGTPSEYYALILDDFSFKDAPIKTGVYVPMAVLTINGERFTYTGAPVEIEQAAQIARRNPVIFTDSLAGGMPGKAYAAQLRGRSGMAATAGEGHTLKWSIGTGKLPEGLSLDADTGVISGTPAKSETAYFQVRLTEKENDEDPGRISAKTFSIAVSNTVKLGTIEFGEDTIWVDRGRQIQINVPVNVDLAAAGLSQTQAFAYVHVLRADGTTYTYPYANELTLDGRSLRGAIDYYSAGDANGWQVLSEKYTPYPGIGALHLDDPSKPDFVAVTGIDVELHLKDDNGNYVYIDPDGQLIFGEPDGEGGVSYHYDSTDWPEGFDLDSKLVKTYENPSIEIGGYVTLPKLEYEGYWRGWPCTDARAKVWPVDSAGNAIGGVRTVSLAQNMGDAQRTLWLAPGMYRFTVEGLLNVESGEAVWVDILKDATGATLIRGTTPATCQFTVASNDHVKLGVEFSGEQWRTEYTANVAFEGGAGDYASSYQVEWYENSGSGNLLIATGKSAVLYEGAENIFVRAVPTGNAASVFQATDYVAIDNASALKYVNLTIPRKAAVSVSGTVSCETGWQPSASSWGRSSWGTIRALRPMPDGRFVSAETVWLDEPSFAVDGITAGSRIVYTPPTESACTSCDTLIVTADADAEGLDLQAPVAKGVVVLDGLDYVAADRDYDSDGADFTADDEESARTRPFNLQDGLTSIAVADSAGKDVRVSIIGEKSFIIQDENLQEGKTYRVTVKHRESDADSNFGALDGTAAIDAFDVQMSEVSDGLAASRIGAAGVDWKLYSRGRAIVYYANPAGTQKAVLIYGGQDGQASLLEESTSAYFQYEGAYALPFMDAGDYTLCFIERDAFGNKVAGDSGASDGGASAVRDYSTLGALRNLGLSENELVEVPVTLVHNKVASRGTASNPIDLPRPAQSDADIIDHDASSVGATSSYSNYTTIAVQVVLRDGVELPAASLTRTKLEIYTNQRQLDDEYTRWVNPKALSLNGKPVALTRWDDAVWAHDLEMTDGWLRLGLSNYMDYEGTASFPLTCSVTVPRTDFGRTQVWAYLNVNGRRHFIGAFDETVSQITLAAPEVTAQRGFTARGFTMRNADVSLYLDGMEAATVKADEYGYYSGKIQFPAAVEDNETFYIQATASWTEQGELRAASSEALDVTYSTTRPSLKRVWMLWQENAGGPYKYMLVYDNGDWPSMYRSFYRPGNETGLGPDDPHANFCWLAEIENAELAGNVSTVVPSPAGDAVLPMTQSLDDVVEWFGLQGNYRPLLRTSSASGLSAQSAALMDTMALGDGAGTLPGSTGTSLILNSLLAGNSFVCKPTYFNTAPSGAYVTFDEAERLHLPQTDAFIGFSGLAVSDIAAYIRALNNKSPHLKIVEQEPAVATGGFRLVDPAAAAEAYANAPAGTVDEYMAVAFNTDYETGSDLAEADIRWLQVHHTVTTSQVDMGEPVAQIASARAKYEEFKAKGPRYTTCPCKIGEPNGVPIADMMVAPEGSPDSLKFFVWSEDSNRNTFLRVMEEYDVAGTDAVAYRLYETDERHMVITEWNGQTGQKTVVTYEITDNNYSHFNFGRDSAGNAYAGPNNTDFAFLLDMWAVIGTDVQWGMTDAEDALIADPTVDTEGYTPAESEYRLTTQDWTENAVVRNIGYGAEAIMYSIDDGVACAKSFGSWCGDQKKKYDQIKKDLGLKADWGNLSEKEWRNINEFITLSSRRGDCLWEICTILKSAADDEVSTAWSKAAGEAYRGSLHKVYDAVNNATSNAAAGATSFNLKGPLNVATEMAKATGKAKLQEHYNAWKQNKKTRESVNGYSQDYYNLVRNLYRAYKLMDPKDRDCVDWTPLEPLIFQLMLADEQRADPNRDADNGSDYPKAKMDPSGMVYEGTLSNPVEGATVKLYTYSSYGDPEKDKAVFVDSEKFGYEANPQVTGADGRYQWFVPEGYWQVRVSKEGYEPVSTGESADYGLDATKTLKLEDGTTVQANSYWMPVLPEQIDVNIPLRSTAPATIESVEAAADGVTVIFSKPMKVETVTADMFTVQRVGYGAPLRVTSLTALDEDVAADGLLGSDGKVQRLARKYLLAYPEGVGLVGGANAITVTFSDEAGTAMSYAGTALAEGSRTKSFESEMTMTDVSISEARVMLSATSFTYNAKAQYPTVKSAELSGVALESGKDYSVSYLDSSKRAIGAANIKDAGTYYLRFAGKGNYAGVIDLPFAIAKAPSSLSIAAQTTTYTGKAQPYTGKVSKSGSSGKVTFAFFSDKGCAKEARPVDAGVYYVKATLAADANYRAAASAAVTFTIAPAKATPKVALSKKSLVWTGKAQKPKVTVKLDGKKLSAKAYKLTWSKGRKNVGAYKVKVTLIGNYKGAASASFKIVPKGTKVAKVAAASKGFTVKWKKQAKQTTGYQVQYSLKKNFKSAKTVTVKGAKKASKKISKLKPKKKYYVRVRTYKTVKGKKYYSAWSKAKAVTTRK